MISQSRFTLLYFIHIQSLKTPTTLHSYSLNDYLHEIDQRQGIKNHTTLTLSNQQQQQQQEKNNNNNNNNSLPPNFAQAALLLQNSSGVYSRKVEYLHSLVLQSYHSLMEQGSFSKRNKSFSSSSSTNKKQQQQRGNTDEDITTFEEFDSDLQFLLLDDVLPIDKNGNKINLRDKQPPQVEEGGITMIGYQYRQSLNSRHSMSNLSTTCNHSILSIGLGTATTKGGKDDPNDSTTSTTTNFSSNSTAAIVGNMTSNVSLQLMNGACNIHSGTGALLMPGTTTVNIPMFQTNEDEGCSNDNGMGNMNTATDVIMVNGGSDDHQQEQLASMDVAMNDQYGHDDDAEFDNGGNYDNDDDDDNGGVGFILNNEDTNNHDANDRTHQSQTECSHVDKSDANEPEIQDPWEMMLDPHDNSKSKIRPLRSGKTLRLPPELDGVLPSDLVTGSRTKSNRSKKRKKTSNVVQSRIEKDNQKENNEIDVWWKHSFLAAQSYHEIITVAKEKYLKRQSYRTTDNNIVDEDSRGNVDDEENQSVTQIPMTFIPLQGHLFENEFEYIAKDYRKRKAAEKRKRDQSESNGNETVAINTVAAAITQERFREMYEDDDDVGPIDFDCGGAEYDDGNDDDHDIGGNINDEANDDAQAHGALHEFDQVFRADHGEEGTDSLANHDTFEELCRAHLKEFAKGAEQYAVETQLTRRVAKWQSKLEGILSEEEKRPEFNIQTYSNKIIGQIGKESKRNPNTDEIYKVRSL